MNEVDVVRLKGITTVQEQNAKTVYLSSRISYSSHTRLSHHNSRHAMALYILKQLQYLK